MQAKQLTIRHVGNPGERMPVRLVETGKSPNHIAAIQTRADMNVLGDIGVVVKHQKLMMHDRAIQQQSGKHEQCAQQYRFLAQIASQSFKRMGTHR